MPPDTAISIVEAARILGISRSTLYILIKQGRLPTRKLGKRSLILRSELEAFMKSLPTAKLLNAS